MTRERYFRLTLGDNEKQYGMVLRVRDGNLEELIGFSEVEKVGETSRGSFYELDINRDGYGKPLGKPDTVGILVPRFGEVEIYKQPEREKASISNISMSRAAEIIESLQYIRDIEAYMAE